MVGLEFEPIDHEAFGVDVSFGILPGIRIGDGHFRGFRIDRTRERIAADGNEDFALIIALSGDHHAAQSGREVSFGPRQAVLTTDAEPASVRYGEGSDFIVLQPSRPVLSALVPCCDDAVARPIDADSEPLRLLRGYVAMLRQGDALASPELRHVAATHLLDLVALALGATRDAAAEAEGGGLRAGRLAAVKADVDRHLLQTDLSIGAVAARQRITPRYIARLFASEGTTFTDHVRDRRLERARRHLIDPRGADRPIGAVAFECGFSDLSYFNRCFRARFGASPSELRAIEQGEAGRRDNGAAVR
jgi:AraC-like DNA-binding protein